MLKKCFLLLCAGFLFIGIQDVRADWADVYYDYWYEDWNNVDDNAWVDRYEGSTGNLAGPGTVRVNSIYDQAMDMDTNYARATIVDKALDYESGASAEAAFDNMSNFGFMTGGTGGSSAYVETYVTKAFQITGTGPASVVFSLDGFMETAGMGYAGYDLSVYDNYNHDQIYGKSVGMDQEHQQWTVDLVDRFEYSFDEADIGQILALDFELYVYAEAGDGAGYFASTMGGGAFEPEESGHALADFENTLSIDLATGGIVPQGDPVPTPIPGAGLLLLSGLVGMVGIRRRR